jgi:heme o synthase
MSSTVQHVSGLGFVLYKAKAFVELLKVRLSMLVAFSCAFGYALATKGSVNWEVLIMLFTGGFLLSGASGAINQVIEKDFDKVMTRTQNRKINGSRSEFICWYMLGCGFIHFVGLYKSTYGAPLICFYDFVQLHLYSA